jgi:hypothetical protein
VYIFVYLSKNNEARPQFFKNEKPGKPGMSSGQQEIFKSRDSTTHVGQPVSIASSNQASNNVTNQESINVAGIDNATIVRYMRWAKAEQGRKAWGWRR